MWPRWLRALSTVWVAWDSKKRNAIDLFWVVVVFILGPFMVPFYMTFRAASKNEKAVGSFLFRLFLNFEKLLSWFFALAASAVFLENYMHPPSKDLAEVKRAEMKAGSIMGIVFVVIALIVEKVGIGLVKSTIERKTILE